MPFITTVPLEFPWRPNSRHNDVLWYGLLTVENGRIVHESHRSSGAGISGLLKRLEEVKDRPDALLLGVLKTGYMSNVYVIDIAEAIRHLQRG